MSVVVKIIGVQWKWKSSVDSGLFSALEGTALRRAFAFGLFLSSSILGNFLCLV